MARRVERHAAAAGELLRSFDVLPWLDSYIADVAIRSIGKAHATLQALAYFFWYEGLPDYTRDLPVREKLHELTHLKHITTQLALGIVPRKMRKYVPYFPDGQYSDAVITRMRATAGGWEIYAQRHGMDAEHPEPADLARFLAVHAQQCNVSSLCYIVRSLSYFFTTQSLPDVTQAVEIEAFLEGVRREKPRTYVKPLFARDVRRLLPEIGTSPCDLRDHLIILLNHLGPLDSRHIADLNVEECILDDDGLTCKVEGREVFIGGLAERELDIRTVYKDYLDVVPWRTGRLVRAPDRRGGWLHHLSSESVCAAVRRACKRSGMNPKFAMRGIRKGFVIRAVDAYGVIVTADRLGVTAAAVARHSKKAQAIQRVVARRRWEEPPAGPRGKRRRRC